MHFVYGSFISFGFSDSVFVYILISNVLLNLLLIVIKFAIVWYILVLVQNLFDEFSGLFVFANTNLHRYRTQYQHRHIDTDSNIK